MIFLNTYFLYYQSTLMNVPASIPYFSKDTFQYDQNQTYPFHIVEWPNDCTQGKIIVNATNYSTTLSSTTLIHDYTYCYYISSFGNISINVKNGFNYTNVDYFLSDKISSSNSNSLKNNLSLISPFIGIRIRSFSPSDDGKNFTIGINSSAINQSSFYENEFYFTITTPSPTNTSSKGTNKKTVIIVIVVVIVIILVILACICYNKKNKQKVSPENEQNEQQQGPTNQNSTQQQSSNNYPGTTNVNYQQQYPNTVQYGSQANYQQQYPNQNYQQYQQQQYQQQNYQPQQYEQQQYTMQQQFAQQNYQAQQYAQQQPYPQQNYQQQQYNQQQYQPQMYQQGYPDQQ